MRVVYMGTPDFAVLPLQKIKEAGHDVIAVFTQPDREKGRGRRLLESDIKKAAVSMHIPVYQPVRLRDQENVKKLRELMPDLIVVAAYGQILSEEILKIPKCGCINIHASLLPKYRGASPVEACILAGDKETGVTIMHMEKGLDTGDIIEKTAVPVLTCDTAASLTKKLSQSGAELVVKVISEIENGTAARIQQNDSESTYAGKLTKEMGKIDFSENSEMIVRKVHALYPWPCAYTNFAGKNMKILDAVSISENDIAEMISQIAQSEKMIDIKNKEMCPGMVIYISKKSFWIKCGNGAVEVLTLQPDGKKEMNTSAFLNGYKMTIGEEFAK